MLMIAINDNLSLYLILSTCILPILLAKSSDRIIPFPRKIDRPTLTIPILSLPFIKTDHNERIRLMEHIKIRLPVPKRHRPI